MPRHTLSFPCLLGVNRARGQGTGPGRGARPGQGRSTDAPREAGWPPATPPSRLLTVAFARRTQVWFLGASLVPTWPLRSQNAARQSGVGTPAQEAVSTRDVCTQRLQAGPVGRNGGSWTLTTSRAGGLPTSPGCSPGSGTESTGGGGAGGAGALGLPPASQLQQAPAVPRAH